MITRRDCLSRAGGKAAPSWALCCLMSGHDKLKSEPVLVLPNNTTMPECACVIERECELMGKNLGIGSFDPGTRRGQVAHGTVDHRIDIDDQLRRRLNLCAR
jgi:hypothetical protein